MIEWLMIPTAITFIAIGISIHRRNRSLDKRLADLRADIEVYEHVLKDRKIEITKGLSKHD